MKRKQIDAIFSDYDGTLCSTTSIRGGIGLVDTIPKDLEQILFHISKRIPICIISSKDFVFLHKKTRFANILSCVLGIETIIHNPHYNNNNEIDNSDCIRYQGLTTSGHYLMDNSKLLHNIVEILQNHNYYKDIMIEEKYTSNREILIGLTIDYRHLEDWQSFKDNIEPSIREMIQRSINVNLAPNTSSENRPFIQTYSNHPFLDVYGTRCDKGIAFDSIFSQLEPREGGIGSVMYLGDSENDNPAFRKADVSIGVRSDERLKPKLDCKYTINFNEMPAFLKQLYDNNLVFSASFLEKTKRD